MTVKELKDSLDKLPDNAEAVFSLWTESGNKTYWFNNQEGKKIFIIDNQLYAKIAGCDDCPAYRINTKNAKFF